MKAIICINGEPIELCEQTDQTDEEFLECAGEAVKHYVSNGMLDEGGTITLIVERI